MHRRLYSIFNPNSEHTMSKESQAPTEVTPPATEQNQTNRTESSPEQQNTPAPASSDEDTNS